MNLVDYPDDDGMKVWLDRNEVELLLQEGGDTEQKIAFLLGVRSGLRVSEIVGTGDRPGVRPSDVVETSAGPRVRVWNAKGGKHRETPAPPELVHTVDAYADAREAGVDVPLVDRVPRTMERWVSRAADRLAERTDDQEGWEYLTPHDLRRTWATMLAADDVDPLLVCDWGGWEDIEVFLEHYRGSYSPAVQRRELQKVDWLGYGDGGSKQQDVPAPRTAFEET
jgi:integrase